MREPHIYTPANDPDRMCPTCGRGGRPFADYIDQPDTASRVRADVLSYPFALPEKREGKCP